MLTGFRVRATHSSASDPGESRYGYDGVFGSGEGQAGKRSSDNSVMYRKSLTAEAYITKLHFPNTCNC